MKKKKEQYISKSGLVGKLNWTVALIEKFLKGADKMVPNPHYKSAPEMYLYSFKRIKRVEKGKKFITEKEKINAKKLKANKPLIRSIDEQELIELEIAKLEAQAFAIRQAETAEKGERKEKKKKEDAEKQRAKTEEENKVLIEFSPIFGDIAKKMFSANLDAKVFIHCGKTNSGKTYSAINRLKEVENGVYLAPLRLLAWEIFDRLNSEGELCSLITGEEQIITEGAKFVASTIEMMDYSQSYDVVIIDEAFMIGDKERGKAWLKAMLCAKAKEIHIISNEDALLLIENILRTNGQEFEVKRYEMLQKFKFSDTQYNINKQMPPRGVCITFSRLDVLLQKTMFERWGRKVSVLYGNLPPEVKRQQISAFINGETELMVATDVIGMGINLPCDYIIFLRKEKFDGEQVRDLNPMEIRQIAGRTGRYGLSEANSFVSCVSKHGLNVLKTKYYAEYTVEKAYIGFDYEMFSTLPEKMTVIERIMAFKKIDFIPEEFKAYLVKENINRYLEISNPVNTLNSDLRTKWNFLCAPVKDNNIDYFRSCIGTWNFKGIITPPSSGKNLSNDAKTLEDEISKIELYLNLTKHISHNAQEREDSKVFKESLVERLIKILLDKKLSAKKKCKLCPKLLDITYPHPYCNSCYQDKIRVKYTNYYDEDDDDDYGYRNYRRRF